MEIEEFSTAEFTKKHGRIMEQTEDTTVIMEQNQPMELKKLTPLGELLGQALRYTVKLFPKAIAVSVIIGICILSKNNV